MLEINYRAVKSAYVGREAEGIRILQFSDTHISDYFSVEDLMRIVDVINSQSPDIVVFTGDLIDHYRDYSYTGDPDDISDALRHIKAPLGKFAIYGNHDYGGGAHRVYRQIMADSGFIMLINDNYILEEHGINIIGSDDALFGELNADACGMMAVNDMFNIVLSHEPDVIDSMLQYDIDLFLSGHSHGGQVNVPVLSRIMLPPLGQKYVRGIYSFDNSRDAVLNVNIGIGTSQIPLRFLAVPEISVIELSR